MTTTSSITIEEKGARLYVRGNTYPIKDALKNAGCKWDGEEKAWWAGKAKRPALEAAIGAEPVKEDLLEKDLYAQVSYQGKKYYVIAAGDRVRLTDWMGKLDFWVNKADCVLIKEYKPRTQGLGKWAREERQTLAGLHRFVERARREDAGDAPTRRCWECGCSFTQRDARENQGDWSDSYCGC